MRLVVTDVARSVVCLCVSVCLSHGFDCAKKRLNWSRARLVGGGLTHVGPRNHRIGYGSRSDESIRNHEGWQETMRYLAKLLWALVLVINSLAQICKLGSSFCVPANDSSFLRCGYRVNIQQWRHLNKSLALFAVNSASTYAIK